MSVKDLFCVKIEQALTIFFVDNSCFHRKVFLLLKNW